MRPFVIALRCGYIAEYLKYPDGKDYQRGSIEKDGNRQRNSETIQDEEITISTTSYKT